MPVLADQQHLIVVIQDDDGDRTRVVNVLAMHHARLAQVHAIIHQVKHVALVDHLAAEDWPWVELVGNAHGLLRSYYISYNMEKMPQGTSFTTRPAACSDQFAWNSSAAFTRPSNSGCALVGRDLNSG